MDRWLLTLATAVVSAKDVANCTSIPGSTIQPIAVIPVTAVVTITASPAANAVRFSPASPAYGDTVVIQPATLADHVVVTAAAIRVGPVAVMAAAMELPSAAASLAVDAIPVPPWAARV